MPEIAVSLKARPHQKELINYFRNGGKHASCIWHRKAGKDRIATFIESELACNRVGLYWHALPNYADARKVIWDAITPDGKRLIDASFPPEIIKRRSDHEMKLELVNGSIWQPVGADNYNGLVGAFPIHITWSEFALMHPAARPMLLPGLAAADGTELVITTPRGYNHAYDLHSYAQNTPSWFASLLTVADSGLLSEETLAGLKATMPEELYRQEYLCDWSAANVGAILGRYLEEAEKGGRVRPDVEYDPNGTGIHISSDIGRRDTAAWWFWQPCQGGFRLVDYDEDSGMDADEWCDRLSLKLSINGYKLERLWLPHDARAKTFAAKHSAMEIFLGKFGAPKVRIVPQMKKADYINAARMVIRHCVFSSESCKNGLDALRSWQYEFNAETSSFSKDPKHDWACFVGDTDVATPTGTKPLRDFVPGDEVVTPAGVRKVEALHRYDAPRLMEIVLADGRFAVCTPEHKFFTQRGLVPAEALSYADTLFNGAEWSWRAITSILKAGGTTGIHAAITDSFLPESKNGKGSKSGGFIAICGRVLSGLFRQSMKFITSTVTPATTTSTTSPACLGGNISACMGRKVDGDLRLGTEPLKDNGIIRRSPSTVGKPTEKRRWTMPLLHSQPRVSPLQSGTETPQTSPFTSKQGENPGPSAKRLSAPARYAVRTFLRIGHALNSAGRIAALKTFERDTPVYDLTVEQDHCFIANGILTSNSHAAEAYCYGAAMFQQDIPKASPVAPTPIKGIQVGVHTDQTLDQLWEEHKRRSMARRKI
jgi:phage terminase large subunit